MPIEFKCPSCAVSIRVSETHAGKKGHCPSCRANLRVPVTGASNSSAIDKVKSSSGMNKAEFITFACPSCSKMTGFPVALAGTAASCPICQASVMVPGESGGTSFVVGSREIPAVQTPDDTAAKRSPLLYAVAGVAAAGILFAIAFLWGKGSQTAISTAQVAQNAPAPTPSPAPVAATPAMAPAEEVKAVAKEPAPPPLPRSAESHDESARDMAGSETPKSSAVAPETAEPKVAVPDNVSSLLSAQEKKAAPHEDDSDTTIVQKKPAAAPAESARDAAPDDVPEKVKSKPEAPASEKKAVAAKTPDHAMSPAKPAAPAPVCAQCLGTGFLPLVASHIYVHGAGEAVTPAITANAVPWRLCTRCGIGKDIQTLVAAEATRLAAAPAMHKKWEDLAGVRLSYVETHHVTLRSTMSETELKIVATAIEQLSNQLEQSTLSTVMTQIRPDTDEILIGGDNAGYRAFLDALQAIDPKSDWALAKDSTGFLLPHMAVLNAQRGGGMGARDMALYQYGEMLIMRATDNKAPAWLRLGFAAYCENLITKKNLVYAFQYEKNEVHFGDNWDNEIKKFAAQSKLKTWDLMFLMQPVGATALDYLTCYSMVNFFMTTDPKLFPKLALAIKDGLDSEHAVQKVYNTDYKRIQMMWANWAIAK
jgi:hypothetical protein